ncbi:MAG TPA: glycosyltransferase [Noviherbaspirillum sp.]|uniref:glycosyltransferase family 2 protein n=1 Tax=Noviherbaspirillum sp. TaxID=1926288 RepID=UPI002B471AD1|nr:glycosyltransferase [Noviherbaspirillum sp.]HJV86028.1 glycosyltransferase [Noviherbaspirillum sp.]
MTKILAFNRNRRTISADSENRPQNEGGTATRRRSRDRHAPPSVRSADRSDARNTTQTPVELAVSIVVPTRGRPQLLSRCIASLVLQRFDPARFEIIIVDDGASIDASSEETRHVVAGWSAHTAGNGPQIVYIPSMGPHGPAAARNHGWRAARAPIIAFTDDDTIARSDWLNNGVRAFDDNVHVVCGRVVMPMNGTPTDYELDAKNLETAEFVTANCFCRKRVLEDIGGFDERFRFAWREDSDLHFRLIDYRANIRREPRAVMMHPIRPAGWGVSLKQVKKVQFDALLYKKHPRLYRRKIRQKPRWDFYVTVGALLVCSVALLAGSGLTALAAGLVWFVMTARFCAKRLWKTSKSPAHIAEMIVTSVLIPPLAVYWRAVGAIRYRAGLL